MTIDLSPRTRWRCSIEQCGAVEGDAARHRRGDDDRRSSAPGAASTSGTRRSASPTATASSISTIAKVVALAREPRRAVDGHRGAAAGTVRHADLRRRRRVGFAEKPHGSSGWVNGGFFVASPEGVRLHRRRRHRLRARRRWSGSRRTVSCPRTSTTASGTGWTRSGTRSISSDSGTTTRRRGSSGATDVSGARS